MPKKSRFHEALAVSVAAGSSIKAAAEAAGCSVQTAYNVSSQPDFRLRVSEIRTQMTVDAVGMLTAASLDAVNVLRDLLKPENEPSVRLQAATKLLTLLRPITESCELRARLDALEAGE